MSRDRAVVAEVATRKVRCIDDLAVRARHDESVWKAFDSEESVLQFRDDVLARFPDLEVTVVSSVAGERGRVFTREDRKIQCGEFTSDGKRPNQSLEPTSGLRPDVTHL